RTQMVRDFLRHDHKSSAEECNVETQMTGARVRDFFFAREQIEKERRHSRAPQHFRDRLVAYTQTTAPAAMRKQNNASRVLRNFQVAGKNDTVARRNTERFTPRSNEWFGRFCFHRAP